MADGETIQQFLYQGSGNQRWRIVDTGLPEEGHAIPGANPASSKQYQLIASHSGKAVAPQQPNARQVVQFQWEQDPALANNQGQIWHFARVGDGQYVVRNKRDSDTRDSKVLGLKTRSQDGGVEAELRSYDPQDPTQVWEILYNLHSSTLTRVGAIFSRNGRRCLDVPNATRDDDVRIQQHTYNGGDNQKWILQADPNVNAPAEIRALHSSKALNLLTVPGQSPLVVQRGTLPGQGQKWAIRPVFGSEFWIIAARSPRSSSSDQVMDIVNGSRADGAQLQVHQLHGGDNQLWEIWVR
jgi:hypothetical protein